MLAGEHGHGLSRQNANDDSVTVYIVLKEDLNVL
jgi:hypothetical protein